MTAPVPAAGKTAAGTPRASSGAPSTAASNDVDNARSPILSGFLGSLFMLIGSLGVGWLAPVSELRRLPLFIWMRTEAVGVGLCIVLLAVGGMLLVRAWLRLGQRVRHWGAGARKATMTAVVAWGLPMMFSVPLFSRDVYAYIGQGRLMVEGFNPYENGISALSNYFQLGADKMWTEAPVPYGQLFLWIEQFVVWATNVQPEASIMLFRLVALVGIVLCIIYVPKLAELHGVNPHRALWLTAANPLFLTNFIASVHNDALMIGLALAGLYYCATSACRSGLVLVTLSISVKPITIVFLPFIGLLWAGKNAVVAAQVRLLVPDRRDQLGPALRLEPGQRVRIRLDQRPVSPRQRLDLVRARGPDRPGRRLDLQRFRPGWLGPWRSAFTTPARS